MLRLLVALVALFSAALAQAPAAEAAFAPANDEIVSAPLGDQNRIATDAQGNSIVVWSDERVGSPLEVRARRVSAGGGLGPVLNLDPGERAYQPGVATMPSGRTFAAWRAEDGKENGPTGVKGRWIETDGSLGPLLTLLTGGAEVDAVEPHVVIDPAGVATVSWRNQAGAAKIAMRRVDPDNTLSAPVPDIGSGNGHQIAALPNGDTLAVWRGGGIEKNVLSSGLIPGTPEEISSNNLVADPELAVDSAGNGLVAWREALESPFSVRGIRLGPTGAPVGEEMLIDPNLPGGVGIEDRVAADSQGDFLVTWFRVDVEGDAVVYARRVDGNGVFAGPAQPLSPDMADGTSQQAALGDSGTAAVVWNNSVGLSDSTAVGRTVDSLAAPTRGIQELFGGAITEIEVASAPAAGFAAFMISSTTVGSSGLVVRRYLTPPICGDSSATVVQGRPIEAPLACTGLAIEGAQVVTPPAHGEVGAFKAGPALEYTPTPGFKGTDSFTYAASNDGGASNVAKVVVKVGKDTVRPRITSFRFVQSAKKRPANASAMKKKKRTYRFLLRFSEPAQVRVRVERRIRGIRTGKRCRKAGKGAHGKRCVFYRSIGAASSTTDLESVTLTAPRKLAKRLANGGSFRASAVATDPAGNKSKTKTLRFGVKKKPRRERAQFRSGNGA